MGSILVLVAMVLVAARLGSELALKMKQPPVLGELVAGVIIGPSVFGLVEPNETLRYIAQLGAVLLLFEIGLEHDVTELFRVGRSAVILTAGAVLLPFAGGTAAALAFDLSLVPSLFIGGMLTATSIGITARVLTDLGKMNTREARIILGAAVMDDIVGLLLMAFILSLAAGDNVSPWEVIRQCLYAVAFLSGSTWIGIWAARRIVRFLHRMRSRGVLNITAFVFCILMASGAHLVGLSPIIGAFAAGLVFARTEHVMHIREKIEASGDLFIPIFFVMLGVSVELQALNPFGGENLSMVYLGLLLILIALVSKGVSGFVVPGCQVNRFALGAGMIPRGEVLMTFAAMGFGTGLLNSTLYGYMVLLVLVSSFVAPPLLKLFMKDVKTESGLPRTRIFRIPRLRSKG
ncbi:MAG: cation:proton antiporter [Planctomycetota bacterium]